MITLAIVLILGIFFCPPATFAALAHMAIKTVYIPPKGWVVFNYSFAVIGSLVYLIWGWITIKNNPESDAFLVIILISGIYCFISATYFRIKAKDEKDPWVE